MARRTLPLTVESVDCRAVIWFTLSDGWKIWNTLGMSGPGAPDPIATTYFRSHSMTASLATELTYNDSRRFSTFKIFHVRTHPSSMPDWLAESDLLAESDIEPALWLSRSREEPWEHLHADGSEGRRHRQLPQGRALYRARIRTCRQRLDDDDLEH